MVESLRDAAPQIYNHTPFNSSSNSFTADHTPHQAESFVPATTSETEEMLLTQLGKIVGQFVVPCLTWVGVFFNCASIGFLKNNEVRMRKSLVFLFIFLNVFDW